MTIKHVDLSLTSSPDYEYTVALEGDYFTLRFTYNETMKLYTLKILDSDQNPLLAGVALVPNYPIIGDYVLPGLSGAFILLSKTDQDKEFYKLYPQQINEYYTLHYVYDDFIE
jgi:hypothetical protein